MSDAEDSYEQEYDDGYNQGIEEAEEIANEELIMKEDAYRADFLFNLCKTIDAELGDLIKSDIAGNGNLRLRVGDKTIYIGLNGQSV